MVGNQATALPGTHLQVWGGMRGKVGNSTREDKSHICTGGTKRTCFEKLGEIISPATAVNHCPQQD